jgi:hypothetical protein
MGVIIGLSNRLLPMNTIGLLSLVIIGIVVYLLSVIILNDDLVKEKLIQICNKLIRKKC